MKIDNCVSNYFTKFRNIIFITAKIIRHLNNSYLYNKLFCEGHYFMTVGLPCW